MMMIEVLDNVIEKWPSNQQKISDVSDQIHSGGEAPGLTHPTLPSGKSKVTTLVKLLTPYGHNSSIVYITIYL